MWSWPARRLRASTFGEVRLVAQTLERPDLQAPLPQSADPLGGSEAERRYGMWAAQALFWIGVAYAVTMVTGFASMGNTSKPLADPYLAVVEVLILVMAPILVLLMVVIHHCAPLRMKLFSLTALAWMVLLAGVTVTVHLVLL